MPKPNLKQKLKHSQHVTRNLSRQKESSQTKQPKAEKPKIQIPKIKLPKIKLTFKKSKPDLAVPEPPKSLPKGVKIVDKYSLYEPFAQVVIIQDPKTGEYKYILRRAAA